MNLHLDAQLFPASLRSAAENLKLKLEFVEKDYWITLLLWRLNNSKHRHHAVFKGGTSLSKAYGLIDRFSTDVDIAIIADHGKSNNEVKTIIRTLEKDITSDFQEVVDESIISKGSRFRKSLFGYKTIENGNGNNNIVLEINSFANPYPFERLEIRSMVFDFLIQTADNKYIEQFGLQPFVINVLKKEQTLLEKLVSIIRVSFHENSTESISSKIRHFYDLYYLMQDPDVKSFVDLPTFKDQFMSILTHDIMIFHEPKGWQNVQLNDSPLLADFPIMWEKLIPKYRTELTALAYRQIPDASDVGECITHLLERIR